MYFKHFKHFLENYRFCRKSGNDAYGRMWEIAFENRYVTHPLTLPKVSVSCLEGPHGPFGVAINFNVIIRKAWFLSAETATRGVLEKRFFLKISQYTHVFSCESCKIFKNTYFEEHLLTAASTCEWNIRLRWVDLLQDNLSNCR